MHFSLLPKRSSPDVDPPRQANANSKVALLSQNPYSAKDMSRLSHPNASWREPVQSSSSRAVDLTRRNISKSHLDRDERICSAVGSNRKAHLCREKALHGGFDFCRSHDQEFAALIRAYDAKETEAENIEKSLEENREKAQMLVLIEIKKSIIKLRYQAHLRFYSRGGDDTGYSQRILTLQADTRQILEDLQEDSCSAATSTVQSGKAPLRPTPETQSRKAIKRLLDAKVIVSSGYPNAKKNEDSTTVDVSKKPKAEIPYRQLLSQQVRLQDLDHLGPNHPLLKVKRLLSQSAESLVRRLLEVAPYLDDSTDQCSKRMEQDSSYRAILGERIARACFRRTILALGRPEMLELASKSTSIIDFLRNSLEVEELIEMVEWFQNINGDTLRILRLAIGDIFLLNVEPTISILGGLVSIDDHDPSSLKTEQWDLIFSGFKDIIPWYLLPRLFITFQDCISLSRLLLLARYGEEWLDEKNPLRECVLGTYLGFILTGKGLCDPPITKVTSKDGVFKETHIRNWIIGCMSTDDPFADKLLDELKQRTGRILVIAWKGANLRESLFSSETTTFLKRTRTAKRWDKLSEAEWKVEFDDDIIKSDLRRLRSLYGETYDDYWQFAIIDRAPNMPNQLVHLVTDALLKLKGDPPFLQLQSSLVDELIPEDEWEEYRDNPRATWSQHIPPNSRQPAINYEGTRDRSKKSANALTGLVPPKWDIDVSYSDSRFISSLCINFSSHNLIRPLTTYTPPQAATRILQAEDGKQDMYLDYAIPHPTLTHQLPSTSTTLPLSPSDTLDTFAQSFKSHHPTASFAKGTIKTHYCAWPTSPSAASTSSSSHDASQTPNFITPEGIIYAWNVLPFDFPYAANIWQSTLAQEFKSCEDWSRFYLTDFVICALDAVDAESKLSELFSIAEPAGWKLEVAPVRM